jgi:LmbE family N-acetylglucosaminyl deacetylase
MTGTVLHFAPHPDDELLGAPATLMALRDAGYRVVNIACSLGRPEDERRRRQELEEASRLAGFESNVPEPPVAMSSKDDPAAAGARLLEIARTMIGEYIPEVIVGPSPHDRHPAHELVGRAIRDAMRELASPPSRWWMWGIWGGLPLPTLGTKFDERRLAEILGALEAHVGEIERNDYRRLLRGRAEMNSVLAPELLFGFGSAAKDMRYVELLTEVSLDGRWRLGRSRWLDAGMPFAEPTETDAGEWLTSESVTEMIGPPGAQDDGHARP